jgi:TonB-dependent receptor
MINTAIVKEVSALREWTPQVSPGPDPYTGLEVPVLTLPLIESTREHRQRSGFVLNSDARFGDLALFWRSNVGRDWARRDRSFNDTDPAAGSPLSLTPASGVFSGVSLSRRNQQQVSDRDAGNFSFGAKTKFGVSDVDATLAYGFTREKEPHTLETGFISGRTYQVAYDLASDPYAPVYELIDETNAADTASAYDPTNYRINYLSVTRGDLDETDGSAKFNVKINLQDGGSYLKFGAKLQQRRRTADVERDFFDDGSQPRDMTGLVGRSSVSMDTLNYLFGPVPDSRAVAGLLDTNPDALELNSIRTMINSNTGDYSVTEKSWALYGMGKIRLGAWAVLGGVRVEGTRITSSGQQMVLDQDGLLQGFATAHAGNDYVEVLPGLHLRYEPSSGLLYRGSITRSMSRPNNADIAPYRTLSFIDRRSRIGAPDLKPYLATNLDLSVDKYGEKYGLISFAVFYKKIEHFITDAQYPVEIGNLGTFIEFIHVNGEAARAMGFEFSWQGPTRDLPLNLGRGSLEIDYSFNHGTAHHPTRPDETFPLPRQVDQQGALKVHDERGPLSLDASVSYRSGWWEDLIAPGFDNYITSAWDAEISSAYKFSKNFGITLGASNLLNRPTRHYAGSPSRMNDWQINGVEMSLRAQWKR